MCSSGTHTCTPVFLTLYCFKCVNTTKQFYLLVYSMYRVQIGAINSQLMLPVSKVAQICCVPLCTFIILPFLYTHTTIYSEDTPHLEKLKCLEFAREDIRLCNLWPPNNYSFYCYSCLCNYFQFNCS